MFDGVDFSDPFGLNPKKTRNNKKKAKKRVIKKTVRRPIPTSIKKQVAYKQNYKCAKCKTKLPPRFHLHHKKGVANGGNNLPSNLIAICANCHTKIHHKESLRKAINKEKTKIKVKKPKTKKELKNQTILSNSI